MTALIDYQDKYHTVSFERDGTGVLTVTLKGKDGGPFVVDATGHSELGPAFADIAADSENKVVIITGTDDVFVRDLDMTTFQDLNTAEGFDRIYREGNAIMRNLVLIPVPVIAAVNGPAIIHSEIALTGDVVLASENATFQDAVHVLYGLPPGDGVQILWQEVFSRIRANYLLLTGNSLDARQAAAWGAVNEVLPPADLLPRAREIAHELVKQPAMTLRHTRALLAQNLRMKVAEQGAFGLAHQGFAAVGLTELHD